MNKIIISFVTLLMISSCATHNTKPNSTRISGITHFDEKVEVDFTKHKNTVLVFLSANCPCSHSHVQVLKEMSKKYNDVNFVGVHSNYNERKKRAVKYFKEQNLGFPVIYDFNSEIAKKMGAVKTPHAFIINKNAKVTYNGSVTSSSNAKVAKENFLEMALIDIKDGLPPRKARRKTLGCYIAYKE